MTLNHNGIFSMTRTLINSAKQTLPLPTMLFPVTSSQLTPPAPDFLLFQLKITVFKPEFQATSLKFPHLFCRRRHFPCIYGIYVLINLLAFLFPLPGPQSMNKMGRRKKYFFLPYTCLAYMKIAEHSWYSTILRRSLIAKWEWCCWFKENWKSLEILQLV